MKKSCGAAGMFFAHEVDYLAEKPRQLRVFTLEFLLDIRQLSWVPICK